MVSPPLKLYYKGMSHFWLGRYILKTVRRPVRRRYVTFEIFINIVLLILFLKRFCYFDIDIKLLLCQRFDDCQIDYKGVVVEDL